MIMLYQNCDNNFIAKSTPKGFDKGNCKLVSWLTTPLPHNAVYMNQKYPLYTYSGYLLSE